MAIFQSAKSKKYAGLSIGFAFEALGDLELPSAEQVLAEDEINSMKLLAAVCAEACGETITHGEVGTQFDLWKAYLGKEGGKGCVATIMEATDFLKKNGKWTSDLKTRMMVAVIGLAMGDEKLTENEEKLVGMIAMLMDATKEFGDLVS